jgi:energy-coupling factor transporter ATP-binding protein EcfA2
MTASRNEANNGSKRVGEKSTTPTPMSAPAYFAYLDVENVRCIGRKQTLHLCRGDGRPYQWTLILGDNGVGKTTLLHCLAALEARKSGTHQQLGLGDSAPAIADYPMDIQRTFLRGDGKARCHMRATVSLGCKLTDTNAGRRDQISWTGAWVSGGLVHRHGEQSQRNLGGVICYGYGATRRIGESLISRNDDVSRSIFGASETLFMEDASLTNAEEWLVREDYKASKKGPHQENAKSRLRKAKKLLVDLLPDVEAIRITAPARSGKAAYVRAKTPYGWVGLRELSLGYQALVAWTVDLAARLFDRYPDSKEPLREPAIVLVDEIDLHLHPKWQRRIQQYLSERFPNTQFIVTAHSPLVVQAATDANIALLRREGNHVVIDNDVRAIEGWRIDQVLTSDLFGVPTGRPPHTEELLAERRKLLAKTKLNKAQQARLTELDEIVEGLPTAETPEDIKAMDVIRRAAKHLEAQGGSGA